MSIEGNLAGSKSPARSCSLALLFACGLLLSVSGCHSDDDNDPARPINDGQIWAEVGEMEPVRLFVASCSMNGKVFIFGGNGSEDLAQMYDPELGLWSTLATIPNPRYGAACAVVDGRVYLVGGLPRQPANFVLRAVDVYDPTTDSWSQAAPMLADRYSLAATALDGQLYAIGGRNGTGNCLTTVEVYDPSSDSWEARSPLPVGVHSPAAATSNNSIFVFGGFSGGGCGGGSVGLVYEYDESIDLWNVRTDMPTARHGLTTSVVDSRIYAIGGIDGFGTALSTVEEYDPDNNTWTTKTPLVRGRSYHGAGTVGDLVYVFGGREDDQVPIILSSIAAYAPSNDQ